MHLAEGGGGDTLRAMYTRDARIRFAVVGTGSRSVTYSHALLGPYRERHDLVALCDANPGRMEFYNREFAEKFSAKPIPTYAPADFERMIAEQRVGTVIVTTIDRAHAEFVVRAMNAGCDVICEKPLTIDVPSYKLIDEAVQRTGRRLRVTMNMRYTPFTMMVKQALMQKVVGDVLSLHFEWNLDTSHGADYFRRWHRDIRNSGGLLIHKSSHHFDIINWWLASQPKTVYGMGDLRFYGKANAEARGDYRPYTRATGAAAAKGDPWALEMTGRNKAMYADQEAHDAYQRDQNVFGDGISIQDDMAVMIRYRNRAVLTYHLVAYAPWEGFRCMITGTRGRLEVVNEANACVEGAEDPRLAMHGAVIRPQSGAVRSILVRPHWQKPYELPVPAAGDSHDGGDALMVEELFGNGSESSAINRASDHHDGLYSILPGIAANRSFQTGEAVEVDSLL